jgi:hypothetical protein
MDVSSAPIGEAELLAIKLIHNAEHANHTENGILQSTTHPLVVSSSSSFVSKQRLISPITCWQECDDQVR